MWSVIWYHLLWHFCKFCLVQVRRPHHSVDRVTINPTTLVWVWKCGLVLDKRLGYNSSGRWSAVCIPQTFQLNYQPILLTHPPTHSLTHSLTCSPRQTRSLVLYVNTCHAVQIFQRLHHCNQGYKFKIVGILRVETEDNYYFLSFTI